MKGIPTDRQQAVLDFVTEHIREHGFPPTLREIGGRLGIKSTNGVSDHLRALEKKGCVDRDPLLARGIRVVGVNVPTSEECERHRKEAALYRAAFLQVAPLCSQCVRRATFALVLATTPRFVFDDPRCDKHAPKEHGRHTPLPWAALVRSDQ